MGLAVGVVVVGVDEVDQVDWVIEETRKGTEKERKKKRKGKENNFIK